MYGVPGSLMGASKLNKTKETNKKQTKPLCIQAIGRNHKAIFTSETFKVRLSPLSKRNEDVVERWVGGRRKYSHQPEMWRWTSLNLTIVLFSHNTQSRKWRTRDQTPGREYKQFLSTGFIYIALKMQIKKAASIRKDSLAWGVLTLLGQPGQGPWCLK